MVNLNEFLTFATIVDAGSFSGGAERLGISKALATRHVADLEAALGVKLLHRTTRKLGLTAAGAKFHERCKQVIAHAEQAVREAEQFRSEPGGHIKVSAAIAFGLVIHELTTNAVKYGALSNTTGHVEVRARNHPRGEDEALIVEWRELDGPRVAAPTRRGFGQTVISRSLQYSPQGGAELDYAETGVVCRISLPSEDMR